MPQKKGWLRQVRKPAPCGVRPLRIRFIRSSRCLDRPANHMIVLNLLALHELAALEFPSWIPLITNHIINNQRERTA